MINLFETHIDFCNNHGVFHRCKLNGKDYFFTEERIKTKDVPEGLYKADIRAKWGTDEWATIEPVVVVDHIATIISDEPIEFNENRNLDVDGIVDEYTTINECILDWDEENR
jgi:hypothetical protein